MKHEKVIKREDGTQYQITVRLYVDSILDKVRWNVYCHYRVKGKRNWLVLPDKLFEYDYRRLSLEDREKHKYQNMLKYITEDEIHAVKLELWENLKP